MPEEVVPSQRAHHAFATNNATPPTETKQSETKQANQSTIVKKDEPTGKADKKKKQKKQGKQQQAPTQETKPATKTIADILIGPWHYPGHEPEEFVATELFSLPLISTGLYRLNTPNGLKLKPKEIYEEIKQVAKARFGHELPAEMKKLHCLSSPLTKLALLREICLKLGIQIDFDAKRVIPLSNNLTEILTQLNQEIQSDDTSKEKEKDKKKRRQETVSLTEADLTSNYKYLPFSIQMVAKMFPVFKHMRESSLDARQFFISGNQASLEGKLERALDFLSQSVNVSMQISGPMQSDVAQCIIKMAAIHFKTDDVLQAIELQTKALIILERVYGLDHPNVGLNYSKLAMYYHSTGFSTQAFEYMWRALTIMQVACGEYHPEIANIYLNLGMMYQEVDNNEAAIQALSHYVQQNVQMFGEKHIQTAQANSALAQAFYRTQEFRKAVNTQQKAYNVFKSILPEENPYLKNAKENMDIFLQLSVQQERAKTEKAKLIGINKPQALARQQKAEAQQLEMLRQREKLAQLFEEKSVSEENKDAASQDKATKEEREKRQMTQEETQRFVNEILAKQRYAQLIQRMRNPKNRNVLDILEYQSLLAQLNAAREDQKKQEQADKATTEDK